MKRLTTDTPQSNVEAALNLFYVKDHQTWIRGYGPAPEYPDVTLDDYMKMLIQKFLPDVDLPRRWQTFSCMMTDWLLDDADTIEGVLALLYSAAWAFAEIRERLAKYENIGLDPDSLFDLVYKTKHLADLGGFDMLLEMCADQKKAILRKVSPEEGSGHE